MEIGVNLKIVSLLFIFSSAFCYFLGPYSSLSIDLSFLFS